MQGNYLLFVVCITAPLIHPHHLDSSPLLGNAGYSTIESGVQETHSDDNKEATFYKRLSVGLVVVVGVLSVLLVTGKAASPSSKYAMYQEDFIGMEDVGNRIPWDPSFALIGALPELCGTLGILKTGGVLKPGDCIASYRSIPTSGAQPTSTQFQGVYRSLMDVDGDLKIFVLDESQPNFYSDYVTYAKSDITSSAFSKFPR